jgi:hypothetical protein
MTRQQLENRLWDGIDTSGGNNACWEWQGSRHPDGYGQLDGKRVHRLVYEFLVEPIPEGMMVCHKCDNPPCCNPAHLFLGTAKDNADDMVAKGRQGWVRKFKHDPRIRQQVTEAHVTAVMEAAASGMRERGIADTVGLRLSAVRAILNQHRPEDFQLTRERNTDDEPIYT